MKVLDHGYLTLVESWGSDEQIIEAARMSTGKGFLGWGPTKTGENVTCCNCKGLGRVALHLQDLECPVCLGGGTVPEEKPCDEKLLRFLYENQHHTPFEMAGVTVEVQAPIFVFREWHRHRVPFSYNEMSARYTPLPNLNYVPTVERLLTSAGKNKQAASTGGTLTPFAAAAAVDSIDATYQLLEDRYQALLLAGVPKELARVILPVGRYSRMRASSNLRGWMNFLKLRAAPAAQFEIRAYAEALQNDLTALFPRSMALFAEAQPK